MWLLLHIVANTFCYNGPLVRHFFLSNPTKFWWMLMFLSHVSIIHSYFTSISKIFSRKFSSHLRNKRETNWIINHPSLSFGKFCDKQNLILCPENAYRFFLILFYYRLVHSSNLKINGNLLYRDTSALPIELDPPTIQLH